MILRLISLVLGAATAAAAQAPSAPSPPVSTLEAATAAAAQAPSAPSPTVSTLEETGQVPLDCDKPLGAFQFMRGRYEQKVKANTHTWEDVANYHSTRADWLECVSNGQFQAIKRERVARNQLIAKLEAARDGVSAQLEATSAASARLDEEIAAAQQLFVQCDKAPLPADQAMKTCGPQAFVEGCAASTVKRLFTKENSRGEGPRAHMLRSILQQSLVRRVSLLQCVAGSTATDLAPVEATAASQPAVPPKASAQRAASIR